MRRLAAIAATILLAYTLLVTFALIPLWEAASQTKLDIARTEQAVALQQRRDPNEDEATYEALRQRSDLLSRYFISAQEDVTFFERLERLAGERGVALSIRFLEEPQPGRRERVTLQLTVDGPYEGIFSFLAALETQPFVARLSRVSLKPQSASDETIRGLLTIETLWE